MKLYLLLNSLDDQLADIMPPTTAEGLQLRDLEFASLLNLKGATTTLHNDALQLGDRLITTQSQLVINERAKRVLERFAPEEYLSFLPVAVRSKDGQRHLAEYYFVAAAYEIDALDYDESEFEYFHTRPKVIREVKRWVFRRIALPQFDMFRSRYHTWVANQDVVDAIHGSRLTGFRCEMAWED
jgi:hypothetical protein